MRKYLVSIVFLCVIIATVCHAEERWALLIGIDEYSNEFITPLRGAVNDANALRDTLVKYARFPDDHVFCLTSDDKLNMPNLGNMVTKLRYIASKVKPGDVFVFFFAGHGINFKGQHDLKEQNYLLMYESDIRDDFILPKTSFSVEELNSYLENIQSGNTIVILDACRNKPGAGRGDEDNLMSQSLVDEVAKYEFSTTIYSCSPDERAYEWPGRGRGIFSIALEEALTGKADSNGNGEVTINEVELYLIERVPDTVERELGGTKKQTPLGVRGGDVRAGNTVISWVAGAQETETASQTSGETVVSRELKTEPTQQSQDEASVKVEAEQGSVQQANSEVTTETVSEEASKEEPEKQLTKREQIRQSASGALEELDWETLEPEVDEEETETGVRPLTQQERSEGWVDAMGECYGANVTPVEAQKTALERARRNAIKVALDAEMRVQGTVSLRDFRRSFIALNQYSVYGEIIEEKAPIWAAVENIQVRPTEMSVPLYRVTLRARVAQNKSQSDPTFSTYLRLNNATFLDGEEMILSITPTQDCYVTVFNILSDHTVLILDTSQGDTLPAVSGNKTSSIPSESERQSGKHFRVALPEGRTEDVESVLIIATKDYVPFLSGKAEESGLDMAVTGRKEVLAVLPTYQSALEEINCWLVGIPLEKRAFDMQEYKIIKK